MVIILLELRQFEVLRAIAREGSLAAAARALHQSQPTIAHHLTTLESHVGAPLVHRGARGAALTDVGRLVLPHVQAVLGRVRLMEQDARALVEHRAAVLRIGTFPTAGAQLLPQAVRKLARQGVAVSLLEGEPHTLVEALRGGALQTALLISRPGEPLDLGEEFVLHALLDDPLELVLPADHPLTERDRVPLGLLRDEGWILGTTDWDPADRMLIHACAREGFEPTPVMRTDDITVVKGFVAAGIGVALLPRLGMTGQETDLAVRPLEGLSLSRQIGLAMLRTTVSSSAEKLLQALREQARNIEARWGQEP